MRPDVVQIARDLLGTYLVTNLDGGITSGMIVETEAYQGVTDRASHAYNNRRTARTEIMYWKGGTAYIYLCYGVHSLFNIVTNQADIPHAVLIRGIIPISGIGIMLGRTGKDRISMESGIGPGKVSSLLGIHYSQTGTSLVGDRIWLEQRKIEIKDGDIISGPRIGVQYAGPDALLPYRYMLRKELLGQ